MNNPLFKRLVVAWPFVILGTLAVVFALMLTFSRKAPVIASLEPSMAAPGQTVVLTGDYFGRTGREGSLSLAGEIPPPSLIQSWSDQKIVFQVPEDANSGLVTVSNTQGTSTGVLFTNTASIPTVLKAAAEPGMPLVLAVMPSQPNSGQVVTLTGRGFGLGDEKVEVCLDEGGGAILVIPPSDSLTWTDRSVAFLWPAGAGSATKLTVVTDRGSSVPIPVAGTSPLSFGDPRTMLVEFRARMAMPGATAAILWGPIPQAFSHTVWSLVSSDPSPLLTPRSLLFRWSPGAAGDRQAVYRLSLTSFARKWNGWSSGAVPANEEVPAADDRPQAWWRSEASALKTLTASWGLGTADPWLRLQRLQTGLAASFHFKLSARTTAGLSGAPSALLASGRLDSVDAASLAAFLADQSGLPARLITGLWWAEDDQVVSRIWAEVWLAGAGWLPWDVIDGNPGTLDNRHFAFQTIPDLPVRLLPGSKIFGLAAPAGLGLPSGEASGSGQELSVRWDVNRIDK